MSLPSIECTNLCKNADNSNQLIIDNCSFSISGSGLTAIVGPSGAGKTSLLYCLSGIDKPDSGNVLINKKDIYSLNENRRAKYLRENVGFIFQNYNLIPYLTVTENILLAQSLAKKKISDKEILKSLEYLGIEKLKDTRVSKLSGGEQQRVAISRATLMRPSIVFADEPTGALDSKNSRTVLNYLKNLSLSGTSVFIVTHDISAASTADNLVFMEDGRIVELTGRISEKEILSRISRGSNNV